jgi:hypothetical protein
MYYLRRTSSLSLILIFLLATGATVHGQSLAELAKKEKERRAQTPTKVKVLSNGDVAKFQNGSVTTGTYPEEPPKTANSKVDIAEPAKGNAANAPDAAVAPEPSPVADAVKAAESRSVLAQLQLNDLRNRFYRESDGFFRETIQKDTDLKVKEIDRLDKEIKDAQKQLEDFKREARQNDVPPGWIR